MSCLSRFEDPLPAQLFAPDEADEFEIATREHRAVDDELRALGYESRLERLPDGRDLYKARKFTGRKPCKLWIARFPYLGNESPDICDWLLNSIKGLLGDERIEDYRISRVDDTPISMCRNASAQAALDWGADLILFVDNDMKPDYLVGQDPDARPFLPTAFNFWWKHPGPCMVGAPYCCGGEKEEPLCFRWHTPRSGEQDAGYALQRFGREESASFRGLQRCAALPTGLLLVDLEVFKTMPQPWFYYEYTSGACIEKASTEDVTFTRDCALSGFPLYCAWDSWAGHWKRKLVGKPQPLAPHNIPYMYRQATYRAYEQRQNGHANDVAAFPQV